MEVKSSGQFRMVCPQACFAYEVVRNLGENEYKESYEDIVNYSYPYSYAMEVKSSGQFRMVCPQTCFAYDVVRNTE